jgi:tetratricopeptide (TPR) repeat protein
MAPIRFQARFAAAALLLTLAGSPIASHAFAQPEGPTTPSSTDPSDPAVAQMHLERARALSLLGHFDEAHAEYEQAARLQRANNILPAEALWGIAEIYYGQGRDLQAATVLAELAREAELRGDPVVQVKALMEAAVLYQSQARSEEAARLALRLQPLRNSPYLSDDLRAQIDSRLASH